MNNIEEKLLKEVLKGYKFPKSAQQNPLENSMWENMIDGALKALEVIAISSFDWKLTGIVKLLQSWLKDKREEKKKKNMQQQYGVDWEQNSGSYNQQYTDYSTYY